MICREKISVKSDGNERRREEQPTCSRNCWEVWSDVFFLVFALYIQVKVRSWLEMLRGRLSRTGGGVLAELPEWFYHISRFTRNSVRKCLPTKSRRTGLIIVSEWTSTASLEKRLDEQSFSEASTKSKNTEKIWLLQSSRMIASDSKLFLCLTIVFSSLLCRNAARIMQLAWQRIRAKRVDKRAREKRSPSDCRRFATACSHALSFRSSEGSYK